MDASSGLYGLFRLDGAPVDCADATALGFGGDDACGAALVCGVDQRAPDAIQRSDADGRITVLAGYLEEAGELADRLGLSRATPPADLARAALLRFGAETPAELIGEWTLLHWEPDGRLMLMASAARRDRLFFTVSGARCAVAPDLARIGRIGWVDDGIDEAGLLYGIGRKSLRARGRRRSLLKNVHQLAPADCVTISRDGVRREAATVLTPQPRFRGTFDDAVAESEALLRRIMRQRVARTAMPVVMLSGGLDSSLLAWLASEERAAGQPLGALTLVAPPDSGLPDESRFADIVGDTLGFPVNRVAPPVDADIYRPSDLSIAGADGPMLSNRHCQTEEIHSVVPGWGATMLVNGCYGEMSVTGRPFVPTMTQRLRTVARNLLRGPPPPEEADDRGFHLRLSPHRLADLPDEIREAMAAPQLTVDSRRRGEAWDYLPGVQSALGQSNEFRAGALRMEFPYRDLRLLRLFAGMPSAHFVRDGFDRAPARRMLDGRLPDSIRLRRIGMPAEPDHIARLQRQAAQARQRIVAFRAADLDEWFDLDWLDQGLARIAAHGPAHIDDANQVQLTAINAEVLLWWRTRR